MSAYDWTEIEARAREAGVDFFISKPIFQSVVQDVLLKATRRRQSADTLPVQKEDFAGRRILLVEDNEINMEIARTLLEFRNASVDGACNGQQAVEMFRSSPQNHYDAVLMGCAYARHGRHRGHSATGAWTGPTPRPSPSSP